jgi:hypothetical protein
MSALTVTPRRWYSWDFTIFDSSDRQVADMDLSTWRERATLTVDGVEYLVHRERAMSGEFLLERAREVLARATKPCAFRSAFIVRHGDREYTMRKPSAWRRTFVLEESDREIGRIHPRSLWRRDAVATFQADWPLPVRTFVIWLAIILWKRESQRAG